MCLDRPPAVTWFISKKKLQITFALKQLNESCDHVSLYEKKGQYSGNIKNLSLIYKDISAISLRIQFVAPHCTFSNDNIAVTKYGDQKHPVKCEVYISISHVSSVFNII